MMAETCSSLTQLLNKVYLQCVFDSFISWIELKSHTGMIPYKDHQCFALDFIFQQLVYWMYIKFFKSTRQ
jgi:hypothetical protein